MQIRACARSTTFVNVNEYWHAVFTWVKPYFNVRAIIFYMCERLHQPIANQLNMQKMTVLIYLTMRTTIFDTHCSNRVLDDGITMRYAQALLKKHQKLTCVFFNLLTSIVFAMVRLTIDPIKNISHENFPLHTIIETRKAKIIDLDFLFSRYSFLIKLL